MCHMLFNIKIEDFRHKSRPHGQTPATVIYASVISGATVRIALMIALNHLEVKSVNILNAYLQASVTEQIWTILGPYLHASVTEKVWTILGPELGMTPVRQQ